MRLQKYLAQAGIASRRKCETYILEGKVKVNGQIITTLGTVVKESDQVEFENKSVILPKEEPVYYMLNKPTGYITSVKDERNRKTVLDLFKNIDTRIFPVGRLDYNTSGLLILTNDGDLTYALTHPKHDVDKVYKAKVRGRVSAHALRRLEEGVVIDGRRTAPAKASVIKAYENWTLLQLTIHEGRNRQVRKMCEAVGHSVMSLERIAIGSLSLGNLPRGSYRTLTKDETQYLKGMGKEHVK